MRYEPAGRGLGFGGDWYDIIPLGGRGPPSWSATSSGTASRRPPRWSSSQRAQGRGPAGHARGGHHPAGLPDDRRAAAGVRRNRRRPRRRHHAAVPLLQQRRPSARPGHPARRPEPAARRGQRHRARLPQPEAVGCIGAVPARRRWPSPTPTDWSSRGPRASTRASDASARPPSRAAGPAWTPTSSWSGWSPPREDSTTSRTTSPSSSCVTGPNAPPPDPLTGLR